MSRALLGIEPQYSGLSAQRVPTLKRQWPLGLGIIGN